MTGGLRQGIDACAFRMTGSAFARCAFEDGIDVARFAGSGLVLTLQLEAGCQMVEARFGGGGGGHDAGRKK